MSSLETTTINIRTITTECGEFAVISEQDFDGKKFLALLPKDEVGAFLDGDDYTGLGPELVEIRDGRVWPLSADDKDKFIRQAYEQVRGLSLDGVGR